MNADNVKNTFEKGLAFYSIDYTKEQLNKLIAFYNELLVWNEKAGFIKADNFEIINKHFFDSLSAVPIFLKLDFKTIADVGTGAGFPGIPLSIFFKEKNFTLIERAAKKTAFLENCKTLFNFSNVKIIESDIEKIDMQFDIVVFRALGNFSEYLFKLAALLESSGALFAYKGKKEEIEVEIKSLSVKNYRLKKIALPFSKEERHIVIIQKKDIAFL